MSLAVGSRVSSTGSPRRKVPGPRRAPLWREGLALVWLLWLYDTVNNLSSVRLPAAVAHGRSILHLERVLFLDPEAALNGWVGSHRLMGILLSNFYDNAHFVVTLGLLVWLWWRHPSIYRPLRNALVLTNVIGFVVFWLYPVAPPRMLAGAGFVDVVAVTHTWGAWHSGALASQANELAAMPSLHMAWALWCGTGFWLIARRWPLRALAVLYPSVVAVAVLATANHYFLDVVAGGLTLVVAGAIAYAWSQRRGAT